MMDGRDWYEGILRDAHADVAALVLRQAQDEARGRKNPALEQMLAYKRSVAAYALRRLQELAERGLLR